MSHNPLEPLDVHMPFYEILEVQLTHTVQRSNPVPPRLGSRYALGIRVWVVDMETTTTRSRATSVGNTLQAVNFRQ